MKTSLIKLSFFVLILFSTNISKSLDLASKVISFAFSSPETPESQAIKNVNKRHADLRAKEIQEETNRLKEIQNKKKDGAKCIAYLISNAAKFSCKIVTSPIKTLTRLKNGKKEVITGFSVLLLSGFGLILYKSYQKIKEEELRKEEQRVKALGWKHPSNWGSKISGLWTSKK